MISRRAFLSAAGALAAGGARAAEGPSLAAAARRAGLIYGASIDRAAFDDEAYGALYRREAEIVATDVALKFDWLRPRPDKFDFASADAIFDWAQANGKKVHGAALFWNDNVAGWLKGLSSREIERVFDEHIEKVVGRYAGRLYSLNVVNEPFWPMDRQKGGWRYGPWFAAMGPAYVERAFRRAAAVDRKLRLTLNEAQCENDHDWGKSIRPLYAGLVDRLRQAGAPIAAVEFQSHLIPHWPADYPAFAEYAAAVAGKDLDIHLSELDVDDSSFPDDKEARDAAVARTCAAFLDPVLKIKAVKMAVNWQLSDRYSWYRDYKYRKLPPDTRPARPLPYDAHYLPKRMRSAMVEAFAKRAARPT